MADEHAVCGSKTAAEKAEMESQKGTLTEISVPTAQCSMCAKTIKSAVKDVKGVYAADVDVEDKVASVRYDDKKTDVGTLENAIAEAGYDANDVKRNETAHAKLPACCQLEK
jgi:copper chaperone CopZ